MDQFISSDFSIPTRESFDSPFFLESELARDSNVLARGFNPFKWLTKLIKKIFKFLKKFWYIVILIVLIVISIYFPAVWSAILWGVEQFGNWLAGLSWTQILGLGGAIATIISPEAVGKGLGHIASGAGDGISSIAEGIGNVISNNPLGIAVACGLLYFVLRRNSNDQGESGSNTVINIERQQGEDQESRDREESWVY